MQYLLLLSHAPDAWDDPRAAQPGDWVAYTLALEEAGILVAGAGLQAPDVATTVRVRDGERLLTDGPFAETKEHLIGYYAIEVPDLDTALDWASRVPNVHTGSVEVRPIAPGSDVATMVAGARATAAG